jgi:hypothetical protein
VAIKHYKELYKRRLSNLQVGPTAHCKNSVLADRDDRRKDRSQSQSNIFRVVRSGRLGAEEPERSIGIVRRGDSPSLRVGRRSRSTRKLLASHRLLKATTCLVRM